MLTQKEYVKLADNLCRAGYRAHKLAPRKAPSYATGESKAELCDRICEYMKRVPSGEWVTAKQISIAVDASPLSVGMCCRAMPALNRMPHQGMKLWQWGGK